MTQLESNNQFIGPLPLKKEHNVQTFDCGVSALNHYLHTFALQNHKNESSKAYVILKDEDVVGYFSLTFGSIEYDQSPPRVSQGLGHYPIPVLIIARLAVSSSYQKRGLGRAMLKHALLKAIEAADIAGLRAIFVHAKDDKARQFYEKHGFESSPSDPYHLLILMKDAKKGVF